MTNESPCNHKQGVYRSGTNLLCIGCNIPIHTSVKLVNGELVYDEQKI